ncbi:succinate-semialdehyde dehydrogenase [Paraphoma chrysanthemicola]|nr:succinate-semialdehyde dehydrogenase [Paraphoma chrysanthemicola]
MGSIAQPTTLREALSNKALLIGSGFIGGKWTSGEKKFPVYDPATDKIIAEVADHGIDHLKEAIDHAYVCFQEFRKTTEHERSKLLHQFAALVRQNTDDLAILLTSENGKTLAEAKGEVEYGASFLSWFAEEAIRSYGDIIPSMHTRSTNFIVRQPIGVCAIIVPWNFPIAMITRKLGPALAAGCTVVVKPPSETPLCTLALTHLAQEAGLPANTIQVVPTRDRAAVVELYTNPIIKKVSFTGSTNVGKLITEKAAGTMKKVSMELGGNAPFIVFDDADIAKAIEGVIACKFRCSGQTCVSTNRLFVQRGIHNQFARALVKRAQQFKVGSGMDPTVKHGPLVNEAAVVKVKSHIDDAVGKGAKLLHEGQVRKDSGRCYIEPAIITGVTSDMRVAREETFGPLVPIFVFDTVDEVIRMANDTKFGLAGYFFSANLNTIWQVAGELEVGMVGVNTGKISARGTVWRHQRIEYGERGE